VYKFKRGLPLKANPPFVRKALKAAQKAVETHHNSTTVNGVDFKQLLIDIGSVNARIQALVNTPEYSFLRS
jgi:hypothetical protein